MFKRVCWLLVAILVPLVLLGGIGQVEKVMGETAVFTSFDVIINEWSQGHGGSKEWVELLVVNGPVDLRGVDLGDSSPGDLNFTDNSLWQNVPSGTLIVIYNGSDPDDILPLDDIDVTDCVVTIPHNSPSLFTGNWPLFSNSTTVDNPHLRDENVVTIHDFSTAPGASLHPGSQENAQFNGETAVGASLSTNWSNELASSATPGTGNGGVNSTWVTQLCQNPIANADLVINKTAPIEVMPDSTLVYEINLHNSGSLTATDVIVTDTLPNGVVYLMDDSGFSPSQPDAHTLVWQVGQIGTDNVLEFNVTTTVDALAVGNLENVITATTTTTETNLSNNWDSAVTTINNGEETAVLLDAVLPDGWAGSNHTDEAIALRNVGNIPVNLDGWQLNSKTLPSGITILPNEIIWLTKDASAFTQQFGFAPNGVLNSWPNLTNDGGEVSLSSSLAQVVDVLVYGDGDTNIGGWLGTAVSTNPVSGKDGQIFYRMRDQHTGLSVPDTNTASDWAQSRDDVINGRKVRYPGWDLDEFFFTAQMTETAVLTIAIAPDNAYEAIVTQIDSATISVHGETLTFENTAIADALMRAAERGVSVTLLMEDSEATDQEHYLCQGLIDAGGMCAFMANDNIHSRYDYLHAKFMLIDGERVIVSSQNLSPNSLPHDDKNDGTWGRRGVVLITDAPQVIAHVQTIFARDYALTHQDILVGVDHLNPLPIGFVPITQTGGTTYTIRYPQPIVISAAFPFEIVQSPENSLRDVDGLLGLVNQAGEGDEVLVQQLYERPFWGPSSSNPTDDPNPRLEAYINAALRGARVRILLDEFFDDSRDANSNAVTCATIRQLALQENLRIECALANPTGLGIHNKMILVQIDGLGYIHVGSINGSETSSKANRELALQVQSNEAYAYLADMFDHDWPYRVYLPTIMNNVIGRADHILISEVLYNPPGDDDKEFVELVNPTSQIVDISNFSLGDAVFREDFADVRRFPVGTIMNPGRVIVIATTASAFFAEFGTMPDFEILETETAVPNLIDDPTWGDPATFFQLGNSGDDIILRDANDQVVDVMSYGESRYPGVIPCSLVTMIGAALERFPYWQDTNDCPSDFREWPFPSPGSVSD